MAITAATETVTTTVTTTVATATVTAAADDSDTETVDELIATGRSTDWLLRVQKAGLGDWPYQTVNDWSWDICDQLWVGGDYDLIIDKLSTHVPRADILTIYGLAVGSTCKQPPGAPPGFPK